MNIYYETKIVLVFLKKKTLKKVKLRVRWSVCVCRSNAVKVCMNEILNDVKMNNYLESECIHCKFVWNIHMHKNLTALNKQNAKFYFLNIRF